jgi:2-polyprenyl-6-methoxyphenol hydroxylase-like FAD-dependent oxidoreductase
VAASGGSAPIPAVRAATIGRLKSTQTWELPRILAALDTCNDLYFDRVSQIRMDAWSHGRVALVGDAGFCVSLLAGQGSALAKTVAYVLAGELATSPGRPQAALRRYEDRLRPFVHAKQRAAERFAAAFVPGPGPGFSSAIR